MVYVHTPIITHTPETQTRHSRELASRIDEAIREFRREVPELKDDEVRMALTEVSRAAVDDDGVARQRRAALAVVAAVIGVFGAAALGTIGSSGGERSGTPASWVIVAAAVAVGFMAIAIVRIIRR